jgi:pyruvate, orthophosphate dikinase
VFGKGHQNSQSNLKAILGGKGANLAGMSNLGLSVPPGFTITTEVCNIFHKTSKKLPARVWKAILDGVTTLENDTGRRLGDPERPLLVSVRSGAAISMPGMMDTILNLGINDETVKGLASTFGERFAYDSYRRFLNMFGDVVMGIPHYAFEAELRELKTKAGVTEDSALSADHLKALVKSYKQVYRNHGKAFPTDALQQLHASIEAVFDSWNSERAIKYRDAEGIKGLLGTAVNVQAMCFGNMGETSGTGVCFTRNPNTGVKELYGEYLANAQGEDVVAGIRTPSPISSLKSTMPAVYDDLIRNIDILEKNYHDMQDIEFTVQEGELFFLQTRGGKRAGTAAIQIAVDFVDEKLASVSEAILTVKPEHIKQLLHPQFSNVDSKEYKKSVVAKGLAASPGAAVGKVVLTPEAAEASRVAGEKCILVREDTSPEDVGGMWAAEGVLTATGGFTSHASVVARGWGKPAVCGCSQIHIDMENECFTISDPANKAKSPVVVRKGDWISINGETGEVMVGKRALKPPSVQDSDVLSRFMGWVDEKRKMKVLANADTPADAAEARRNGAQGIGLTRTEHMFFADDRINVVRRMILAKEATARKQALDELLLFQRADFEGIFGAMDGLPVTVRLLDPPLHEFLTDFTVDEKFASDLGMSTEEINFTIQRLQEVNPMLGFRGCRLGIVIPELVEMQARAIAEAALNCKYMKNQNPKVEIMIPLIGSASEYANQAKLIRDTFDRVFSENGKKRVDIKIGTMIEVPRAALTAGEIARAGAEFFSYGTNDLTQMTFGFSRDDAGTFLPVYLKNGILEHDPFETIDEKGVGELIRQSAEAGRKAAMDNGNHHFKAGICGEHGGDPHSVKFFARMGLEYVSCSPFRVPLARLAAAQAVAEDELQSLRNSKGH